MSLSIYQVIRVACQSSRLGSAASDFVNAKNHARVCCVVTVRMKPLQLTLRLSILQHHQNLSIAKKGLIVLFCFFSPLGRVWSYGPFSVV